MSAAGGRPSDADRAKAAAARDPKQTTLFNFSLTLKLSGSNNVVTINQGAGAGGAGAAAATPAAAAGAGGPAVPIDVDAEDDDGSDEDEGGAEGDEPDDDLARQLGAKRRRYSETEKSTCLKIVEDSDTLSEALRRINQRTGFEKVSRAHLRKWSAPKQEKKAVGRPVDAEFEKLVLGNLVFTVLRNVDGAAQLVVVANVAYSYETIRTAAQAVQKLPQFADNALVAQLKLSNKWIVGFLRRNLLRRRRITTVDKVAVPVESVRQIMSQIHTAIQDGGFTNEDVLNADETGIFFGAKPKNQYVPQDAERASAPDGNEKNRLKEPL